MSYNPTLSINIADTVLTFANNNLHWLYVQATITEGSKTAIIIASEAHIDPMEFWESDNKIHYKIGFITAVANGKREAHIIWNASSAPTDETKKIITQVYHGFSVSEAVKLFGSTWVRAIASSNANAGTVGFVSEIIDSDHFAYISGGLLPGEYTIGANYYLSPTTAGDIFVPGPSFEWETGWVREFVGTGTAAGLEVELDVGDEITPLVIPKSIWDLEDVDRTGWAEGKVLKFDENGNLIVGTDREGTGGTGMQLSDLSAIGAITYNPTTGVFSITSGYIVPTTTEKGNYDTAFSWGNHANFGYLKAITKAMVEAVLTGLITSHTHDYDKYEFFTIANHLNQTIAAVYSHNELKFAHGHCIFAYVSWSGFQTHIQFDLQLYNITSDSSPQLTDKVVIVRGMDDKLITLNDIKTLIGGGITDHGALSGLGDDDHTQYYNTARGDARWAQVAGSSSQDFAIKILTCSSTATATNFILSSDKRLKRRIKKLNDLKKFDSIEFKTFELKSEAGRKRTGVIAQELEQVAPEMVYTDETGKKMVAYIDLLCAKIARLEERINQLEGKQ